MGEREALLRAVCENPDDDLPRLVFADWLEEHGEPGRAEFIRITCQLEVLDRECDVVGGLKARAKRVPLNERAWGLWTQYGAAWSAELPQAEGVSWGSTQLRWQRGFASGVEASTVNCFLRNADRIMAAAPVSALTIRQVRGVRKLLDNPYFGRLRVLCFANAGVTDKVAEQLLEPGALDHIHVLNLTGNLISRTMVRRLEKALGNRLPAFMHQRPR